MPKISSQTAGSLEQKELYTTAFRLGKHKEREVVFSQSDSCRTQNILGFRAIEAARRQKQEQYQPSDQDVFSAEIAVLLQEGKTLNDLSPQQIAQAYFCLREIADNKDHEYYNWTGLKGLRLKLEKREVKRLTAQLERRMTGETGVRRLFRFSLNQRERLVLERLIKQSNGSIEKAMADFSDQEIRRVLEKRGKDIDDLRIAKAESSANPTEKKFAWLARNIAGLVEKGLKKRREIEGWQTADDLREFLSPQINETNLTDLEIIRFILENNQDLELEKAKIEGRTQEEYLKYIETLFSSEKDKELLKKEADTLVKSLVENSSFFTVIDTLIHIIDRKLPEADLAQEAMPAEPKPEFSPEISKELGEPEIALMIAKGISEEEMIAKGIDESLISQTRRKYFYKNNEGEWQVKEVSSEDDVEEEREKALEEIVEQLNQREIDEQIDELLKIQAEQDLEDLRRGKKIERYDGDREFETYEKEIVAQANELIEAYNLTNNKNLITVESIIEIKQSPVSDLLEHSIEQWKEKRLAELIAKKEARESVKNKAIKNVLEKNPNLLTQYETSISKITAQDLAELGSEALAVLKAENKIKDDKNLLEKALQENSQKMPEILDDDGNLKPPEQIVKEMAKKSDKIKTAFWLILIILEVIDLPSAIKALEEAGKGETAQEINSFFA